MENKKTWIGILSIVMVSFSGILNSAFNKHVGARLDSMEITFFRFIFSAITALPFVIKHRKKISIQKSSSHILRATIGCVALFCSTYAEVSLPLEKVATIFFTVPLFASFFAIILLKEKTQTDIIIASIVGFFGAILAVTDGNIGAGFNSISFAFLPLFASVILFALSDVLIKNMMQNNENKSYMMLHFAAIGAIVTFVPTIFVWKTPDFSELFFMLLLGIFANLLQLFLFYAFSHANISTLAPFRYVDLIFASMFSYFIFDQIPTIGCYIGAALIIPATFYVGYKSRSKKSDSTATDNHSAAAVSSG